MLLSPPGVEHVLLQGAQAHAAGVLFPSDDDTLHRTILIANINPLINTEQVRLQSLVLFQWLSCTPFDMNCEHLVYQYLCLVPGEAAVWVLWSSEELPHGRQQSICICGVLITRGKLCVCCAGCLSASVTILCFCSVCASNSFKCDCWPQPLALPAFPNLWTALDNQGYKLATLMLSSSSCFRKQMLPWV